MPRVVVSRLLSVPPFLAGVSLVCFLLVYLAPGTIVDTLLSQPGVPTELVDSLRAQYGYDLPWYDQYWNWLVGLASGDWGQSFRFQRPVGELVWGALPYTAGLVIGSYALSIVFGVGLSLWGACRPGGRIDRVGHLGALGLSSVHPIVSTLSLLVLASSVGLLPVGGVPDGASGSAGASLGEWARHAVLPIVALSLSLLPDFYLQSRALFVEISQHNHVRAARATGQSEMRLVLSQVLSVASGPLVAFAGAELATTLNIALLVEVIMAWPGLGRLAWLSLRDQDLFLLLGALLCAAVLVIVGNLLADLVLARLDPRVRMESTSA